VKLQLLDPATELRIGMTADVDFQAGQLQADMIVPTVAVVTENGRPGVLAGGARPPAHLSAGGAGVSSGKDSQILSGIKSGDRVFIDLPPWAKERN
jgi:HlyD family secretion protein